jgi:hypothetical protein
MIPKEKLIEKLEFEIDKTKASELQVFKLQQKNRMLNEDLRQLSNNRQELLH